MENKEWQCIVNNMILEFLLSVQIDVCSRDLDAKQWIEYRMAVMIWRCFLGLAPAYLVKLCGPILSAQSSHSLRSN